MLDTESGTEPLEGAFEQEGTAVEQGEALAAFTEATKPDEPEIDMPRPGHVHLLHGLKIDGVRYYDAQVRELTGADEEAIAKLPGDAWNFGILQTDLVIRRATESLGPLEVSSDPTRLLDLIIGDRDLLFKEILLSTAGSQQEYRNVQCTQCQTEHDLEVNFEDLLVDPTMPDGVNPDRIEVTLRDGTEVTLRWPTGKDQMAVYQGNVPMTQPEVNTKMLARCVLTVSGKVEPDPMEWARDLGVGDRRILLAEMAKMPVVSFKEDEVPCTSCGTPLPVSFGWASLL